MKKIVILALAIFCMITMRAYAQSSEVTLSMHIADDVKQNKAFNMYLSLNSDVDIGACRINISYDKDKLELKNISLEEKSEDDVLYYNDNAGKADIIYMPEVMQDIVIRFKPKGSFEKYDFETFLYEVCDKEGNYLYADTVFTFSLNVMNEVSETSTPEKSRVKTEVSKSHSRSVEIAAESSEESEYSREYRVIHVEQSADQTTFLVFAGIVIIFVGCLAFVYKRGFKDGKATERKIDKGEK